MPVVALADGVGEVASFLSVLQLSDSGFPSGRYTLSHGLETFAQDGRVDGTRELLELLIDCLRHGVAPSDGVALACAHRSVSGDGMLDLDLATRADERLTAVKLAREPREASARGGRALLQTTTAAFDAGAIGEYARRVSTGLVPGNHAVVVGLLSGWLGVPRVASVAGELYAFSAGWLSAAVRLGLADHLTAQAVLHRARWVSAEAALRVADRDVAEISSSVPSVDVMSMRHEQAEVRIFAT
jgi:urease accessory protein